MKDIPFTSEVPKVRGAYYWKQYDHHLPKLLDVWLIDGVPHVTQGGTAISIREGFWSPPLIPTSILKTAVKEAWEEGFCSCCSRFKEEGDKLWAESNARKIVEEP